MAQRHVKPIRESGAGGAGRRTRGLVLAALLLLAMAACVTWLRAGVPGTARLAGAISPAVAAQAVPPPSRPSKEYIYAGGRLVATEEPLNDAAFTSQSVPASMTAGQSYAVSVVMSNTGTSTWTAAAGYRLGSQNPQDNATWGLSRVAPPADTPPGGQATFSFTVTAPSTAGTYNFQWRMVQDGVAWFGAASTNAVVTVSAPASGSLSIFTAAQTVNVNLTSEGTQDWAHWGLNGPSGFDRKAGVAPQISNYTLLGSGAPSSFGDLTYAHTWTDGTPTPSATTTTGVYVSGQAGNGFRVTVPADTSTRTLRLYVGAWYAHGQLRAQLSDNSAPEVVGGTFNSTGTSNNVHIITYKANSPGQTLTVTYTLLTNHYAPYGNVTLQAATLMAGAPPPLPARNAAFVSQSVPTVMTAGLSYPVSVTMRNTGANMWTEGTGYSLGSANPAYNTTWGVGRVYHPSSPSYTISGGQVTFNFNVTAPSTPGAYSFQWRMVQDEWFGEYTPNVVVNVSAPTGSGTLAGAVAAAPSGSTVNLTSEGTQDWAHWGLNTPSSFDYKAGVARQISNYTTIGAAPVSRLGDLAYAHTWSDGTPTSSAATTTGVYVSGQAGNGFRVTAPADTATRTLKLYVGAWYARGQLRAELSDGSAAAYVDASADAVAGTSNYVYTVSYRAASAGQTLTLTYTMHTNRHPPYGNITLQAATLSGGGGGAPPTNLVATAASPTEVSLTWAAPAGSVSGYVVERAQTKDAFVPISNPTGTSFLDTGAEPDRAYLYRVKAVFAGGGHSTYSNADLATTVIFYEALTPRVTVIKSVHLTELRRAVTAVRTLAGLGAPTWTYPAPVSSPPEQRRVVYLEDVTDLRTNLDAALSALGRHEPYPPEPATARGAKVYAAHFDQLRQRVR